MNKIAKAAVLVSSLGIASLLIAYEGGYVHLPGSPAVRTAAAEGGGPMVPATSATSKDTPKAGAPEILLPPSKSLALPPQREAPATSLTKDQILMFSSKSAFITAPSKNDAATASAPVPTATASAVLLDGSKSRVLTPAPAPATTTAPAKTAPAATVPTVFLGGSKSDGPIVTPPANAPANKGATK